MYFLWFLKKDYTFFSVMNMTWPLETYMHFFGKPCIYTMCLFQKVILGQSNFDIYRIEHLYTKLYTF